MATQKIGQDQISNDLVASDGVLLTGANDKTFSAASSSLPAGFSWEQQGTSAYEEDNGRGQIVFPRAAFTYMRGIYCSLPGSFAEALFRLDALGGIGNEGPGLILRESSTGKLLTCTWRASGAVNLTALATATSGVGSDSSIGWSPGPLVNMYFKIRKNSSSSWDFLWGPGPKALAVAFGAVNVPTYVGSFTPDQIGLAYLCLGGGDKAMAIDYMKFT